MPVPSDEPRRPHDPEDPLDRLTQSMDPVERPTESFDLPTEPPGGSSGPLPTDPPITSHPPDRVVATRRIDPTGIAPPAVIASAATPPPPEREDSDWIRPAILGIIAGVLIGAVVTFFIVREGGQNDSRDRVAQVRDQRDSIRAENRKLKRQLERRESTVSATENDLNQSRSAARRARERADRLSTALGDVQRERYDDAVSTAKDVDRETVQRAIADNLAARAMKALLDGNPDTAQSLLDEANDYPETELRSAAGEALARYDSGSDGAEIGTNGSTDDGNTTGDGAAAP